MSPELQHDRQHDESDGFKNNKTWFFLLIISCALLSGFTVYDQVFHRTGLDYILDEQLRFHRGVIEGTSVNPWQYRILVPYLIELARTIFNFLGLEISYLRTFFGLRLFQNLLIFYLFARYLTRLRVNRKLTLIGLALLAWGFTYSGYASQLAFDTYFDILFYLIAVLLVLEYKYIWLIPLSIIAAFNRETGIFIPALLLIYQYKSNLREFIKQREFRISAIGLLLFITIFVTLRMWYGPRDYLKDLSPGISLLKNNITDFYSYFSIFATYTIIPVLALIHYKNWPEMLQRFFWIMVPIWIAVHLFTSVIAEARLFLVPYILILLPAALMTSQFYNSRVPASLNS
jgi:hypothetical protein